MKNDDLTEENIEEQDENTFAFYDENGEFLFDIPLPKETYETFEKRAEEENVSIEKIVLDILDEFLTEENL